MPVIFPSVRREIDALAQKAADLERQLEAAEQVRSELAVTLSLRTGQHNTAVGQVNDLTGERNDLTGQVNTLSGHLNEVTGERNALVGQVNEITGWNNQLSGQVNALTAERNELVGRISALTAEISTLTARVSTLTGQTSALTSARNEAVGRNNELTRECNELVGKVNALTGETTVLTRRVEELTRRNAQLVAEANRMIAEVGETKSTATAASTSGGTARPPLSRELSMIADRLDYLETAARTGLDIEEPLEQLKSLPIDVGSLGIPEGTNVFERFGWLPFSLNEAVSLIGISRLVNKRLQEGFYREHLVILITQEKSSSTLHEVVINQMLHHSRGQKTIVPMPRQKGTGPTSMAGGATFHPGILLYFPNGGVSRGVYFPNRQNRWLMKEVGAKRLVLVRHPADRIVAQYCMRASEFNDAELEPTFNRIFEDRNLPLTVDPLVTGLELIEGWLRHSSDDGVLIVRYEDMMADLMRHFERIHDFLFETPMGAALKASVLDSYARSSEGGDLQSGDKGTRSYPRGYSGKAGVWRDYLTKGNVEIYNTVVARFVERSDQRDRLLALYPDLLLDGGALHS